MKLLVVAARLVSALALLVLAACGGENGGASATRPNAAPVYAGTPRKALESWINAVQARDVGMMCRLLYPRDGCPASDVRTSLPNVRAEMRGLKGHLRYGAVNISRRYTLIGVVSGESPLAYAVPLARGMRQWTIGQEPSIRIALNGPDPALSLRSGTTRISFTTWTSAGEYPRVDLWADGRRVDLRRGQPDNARSGRYLWAVDHNGATRLLPGRHVIVAVVRPGGALITARAWVLTVRS